MHHVLISECIYIMHIEMCGVTFWNTDACVNQNFNIKKVWNYTYISVYRQCNRLIYMIVIIKILQSYNNYEDYLMFR